MPFPESHVDVDDILSKLTLEEKVDLLAAKDWWRTPIIKREGVFVPHIKVIQILDQPNIPLIYTYLFG